MNARNAKTYCSFLIILIEFACSFKRAAVFMKLNYSSQRFVSRNRIKTTKAKLCTLFKNIEVVSLF